MIDAGRGAHCLFEPPSEGLLDVLGAHAGRLRPDHQHRWAQLGEGIDAHARRDHDGEDDQGDAQHQHRDRVSEGKAGHCDVLSFATPVVAAACPSSSAFCVAVEVFLVSKGSTLAVTRSLLERSERPSVTTRVPGLRSVLR